MEERCEAFAVGAAFYIAAACRRTQGSAVGWIVLTFCLDWVGLGLFLVNRQAENPD